MYPLNYIEPVFRPPSEWKSLILQVTNGCSWNKCTFCDMYKDEQKRFKPKDINDIENELKFSAFISDAVVIGDKRKFLSCLIMIDEENVMKFAQDHDVPFSNFESPFTASPNLVVVEAIHSSGRIGPPGPFRNLPIRLPPL